MSVYKRPGSGHPPHDGTPPSWLVASRVAVWLAALAAAFFLVTTGPAAVMAQLLGVARAVLCGVFAFGIDRILSAGRS